MNDYLVAFKQDTRVGPFYSKHTWVKGVDKNDAIANYKMKVFIDPCIYGEYEVLQVGLIKKEDVPVEEATMKEETVNCEPSTKTKYLLGTEDINESNPVLYNLHIVEGYDLAGAIREYSELYNLDDTYENSVLIREVEQWRAVGPISGFGVRPRPDKTKPKQDESHEEATMKESIVKGDRSEVTVKEGNSLDIVEYTAQFDISAAGLECDMPYILEMTHFDGSLERRVIVISTMSTQNINYTYWEESGGLKRDTLLPSSFCGDDAYKLYKITEEDLK